MIFTLSDYTLDVDVEKTNEYYKTAVPVKNACSCITCRNFDKALESLPYEISEFFGSLGADLKKAREVFAIQINTDNTIFYGGWLHLCGKIIAGEVVPVQDESKKFYIVKKNVHKITGEFKVLFKKSCDLPDKKFPLPAFQLEIDANVPWVLEEPIRI